MAFSYILLTEQGKNFVISEQNNEAPESWPHLFQSCTRSDHNGISEDYENTPECPDF